MNSAVVIVSALTVVFLVGVGLISWFKTLVNDKAILAGNVAQLQSALAVSQKERIEDVQRLELMVSTYKARLKEAEQEMLKCSDPDERVRRLRELFS